MINEVAVKMALQDLKEQHPLQYLGLLTFWVWLMYFTIKSTVYSFLYPEPLSDIERIRLKAYEDMAKTKENKP